MVDLVGLGTAAAGLGSLFKDDVEYPPQTEIRKGSKNQLVGAFQAADKYGLHRLAVAGSPAGYSPAPTVTRRGFAEAGQAIRDYGLHRENKAMAAKEKELIDAQIEETRSRTMLNNANSRRAFIGPQPGLGDITSRLGEAFDRLSNGGSRTIRREPEADLPATSTVTLGPVSGRGPNAEAFEIGLSELIAGALIYGPQWLAKGAQLLGNVNRENFKGKEPKTREGARRSSSERERRAQQSPYLFGRN